MSGGYFNIGNNEINNIPIANFSQATKIGFAKIVDQILTAKQKDPDADTSALEKQIDEMVYELYELTPEEIAIVEGRNNNLQVC
ncbi:MAG: class I SAM-dependent DNA methyltransferase [Nitrospirota bacterium]